MWYYTKKLEHPVRVSGPNPHMARMILTQFGGPNGELAASTRYLTQRFSMPDDNARAVLVDIGTEELAHLEMLGVMFEMLIDGVPMQELDRAGLGAYYTDHGRDAFYVNASGAAFTANYVNAVGDPIANLEEDIAAEEKARAVYENLLHLNDDPLARETLRFLWSREVVHSQRFSEAKALVEERIREKRLVVPGTRVERSNRLESRRWNVEEILHPAP